MSKTISAEEIIKIIKGQIEIRKELNDLHGACALRSILGIIKEKQEN